MIRTRLTGTLRWSPLIASAVAALCTQIALSSGIVNVAQKGRMFSPGEVALTRGDTLKIVNNDGELVHHAYVDSPTFKFDSGEQEPGQAVEISFPKTGTYTVLCGIHPRMNLKVVVK